jgi:hypothetical protein
MFRWASLLVCLVLATCPCVAQDAGVVISSNVPQYLDEGAAADQNKLANLPKGAKITVQLPSGKTKTFLGAQSSVREMPIGATRKPPD